MALTCLLLGFFLLGVCCEDFSNSVPKTINVMKGSCVTIPCSFTIEKQFDKKFTPECKAFWRHQNVKSIFLTDMTAFIERKDCTTTITNVNHTTYTFRLECSDPLKYDFRKSTSIVVQALPPNPTLTPPTLSVQEGTVVNISCSTPAPCWPHPPALTWTPGLGYSRETLENNSDKTKVKTSVLTFTASHEHDGMKICCNATHKKQDGTPDVTVGQSTTISVSYSPKDTQISLSPSGPVTENSNVTLTCSSLAQPPVKNYSWFKVEGKRETLVGTGMTWKVKVSPESTMWLCTAENDVGVGRSTPGLIQVQPMFPPHFLPSSDCNKTASQVKCSCQTVGNPAPTLHWVLDDKPIDPNGTFKISNETPNSLTIRSVITFDQRQGTNVSTLLCRSVNSLGSTSQRFSVPKNHGQVILPILITTSILFVLLVCVLLFIIWKQKTNTTTPSTQLGKRNEASDTAEATNDGSVIYSSVKWKMKKRRPPPEIFCLEENHRDAVHQFVSCSEEMRGMYAGKPRVLRKEAECDYAQVQFKNKSASGK